MQDFLVRGLESEGHRVRSAVVGTEGERIALGGEIDQGATDYVTKPFSFDELAARVRTHLRQPTSEIATELAAGGITLDLLARRAQRDGQSVRLSEREAELLAHLMRHRRGPDTTGPGDDSPLMFPHKASFIAWFALMTVHVLGHILEVPSLAMPDWRRSGGREAALGLVTISIADPWLSASLGG